MVSLLIQNPFCLLIHGPIGFLVGNLQLPGPISVEKEGSLLQNQTIRGNMLRRLLQRKNLLQCLLIVREPLSRQCAHEIYIDVFKACLSGCPIGFLKLLPCVDSAQKRKLLVPGRLQPHAHAVDPCPPITPKLLTGHGARIHLYGYLSIVSQTIMLPDSLHQPLYITDRNHRRGASAYKDR